MSTINTLFFQFKNVVIFDLLNFDLLNFIFFCGSLLFDNFLSGSEDLIRFWDHNMMLLCGLLKRIGP